LFIETKTGKRGVLNYKINVDVQQNAVCTIRNQFVNDFNCVYITREMQKFYLIITNLIS